MSNDEILNERWKMTDKILSNNLKHFKSIGINTIDGIVDMINSLDITYNDLNKPISKAEKRKLDKNIKEWKKSNLFNGYFAYLIYSKNKYTYGDLIEIMLYWIYIAQEQQFDELSKQVFIEVADDIYNQALKEIPIKPSNSFSLTWEYIWSFLWIPTYNKSWSDYLKLLTMMNQQEAYKLIVNNLQQNRTIKESDLKELTRKQVNRIISINDDKYSGILSDTSRLLGNKIYIEPFKEKNLQVRFIAEIDKRTTKMCEGLNNQLFYVDDWNNFYRYSDIDKKDVLYNVYGLETGVNLPPINNHFHWCRSTITYQLEEQIANNVRNKIKIFNNSDKEQYNRYKKYFGDDLPESLEKFTKMKLNNPERWEKLKKEYFEYRKKYNK